MRRFVRPLSRCPSFAATPPCQAACGHGVAVRRPWAQPRGPSQQHYHHQRRVFSSSWPCRGRPEAASSRAGPSPERKSRVERAVLALTAVVSVGTLVAFSLGDGAEARGGPSASLAAIPGALNPERFVAFEVVARDDVSPTAFVLTLRLPSTSTAAAADATRTAVARARRHGLWSVEVRQPQLQIARDYTPLPGVTAAGDADEDALRLFVRAVPGGEVSQYLARQCVGGRVDLRGPRLSFDVGRRIGSGGGGDEGDEGARRVVIFAGGTGIATALQAADAVLGPGATTTAAAETTVEILWANRLPDDSAGLVDGRRSALHPNAVVRTLQALQQQYGADRVRLQCFVDAQQTFVTERVVRDRLRKGESAWAGWRSVWRSVWLWRGGAGAATEARQEGPAPASTEQQPCAYHTAAVLEGLDADLPRDTAGTECACSARDAPGKNLVLVSGPDGFIAALAGPKIWARGKERQGPVGGVLGRIMAEDPHVFHEWQVLKL